MRIRKRARISPPPPLLPSPISQQPSSSIIVPDSPATHVCELNRSPWDVISFTSQSQEQYGFQIMVDDNDTCNRVKREPASSPDSIAPLNEQYWAKKVKKEIIEEANRPSLMVDVDKVKAKKKVKVKKKEPDYICCNKTDGKGWFCKKEAKEGEVLCEHHIEQLKSYQFNYTYSCRKSTKAKPEVATATAAAAATTTITTTIASKKRNRGKVSSPSPMDFYYYSGFGPKYSWGSRRRAGGGSGDNIKEIKKEENDVDDTNTNIAEASSSSAVHVVDLHDYDDVFDDFDEDEDDEYNGDKKRVRRPVKARSLKSLF